MEEKSGGTVIVVLGGGAAGFFAAVNAARLHSSARVLLLEKSSKLLAKVKVSGGGRCNVTHSCYDNLLLAKSYPRGEKALRAAFSRFSVKDTTEWFESRGVKLKTEEDGRMFPWSDNSQSIIDCLLAEAHKTGVEIRTNAEVVQAEKTGSGFRLHLRDGSMVAADKLVVATGGHPKEEGFFLWRLLGHQIETPVPSLFTFNIHDPALTQLMGLSVPAATVKIAGTVLVQQGPLLITHWGLSGPAVLKLSAWGARELHRLNYDFRAEVSWLSAKEDQLRRILLEAKKEQGAKTMNNARVLDLPARLWLYLLQKTGIEAGQRWADLSGAKLQALVNVLVRDTYAVKGKTTFKEEFVTCGGIRLNEIDFRTMESKLVPGLFFAGEVLDVDGITGGFNFQNAWTTGWIAANGVMKDA